MLDINKNIQSIMKQKGLSQRKLSDFIHVSTSTINNWLKLDRSIPSEYIIPICEFLDIPVLSILNGTTNDKATPLSDKEKEMIKLFNKVDKAAQIRLLERAEVLFEQAESARREQERLAAEKKHKRQPPVPPAPESPAETISIVFFDNPVSAGTGEYTDDIQKMTIEVNKSETAEAADYVVRISGNSMEPTYYDGDKVFVIKCDEIDVGEIGIFNINGCAYIKELGVQELISHNSKSKNIPFGPNDSVLCQGKVIGKLK